MGVVEGIKVGVKGPLKVGGAKGPAAGVKAAAPPPAAEIERLKRQVAEIRTAVAARDEELSRLKGVARKRDRAAADAQEALARKDRKIAALERDLEAEKGPSTGEVAYYLCRTPGCRKVLRVTLDERQTPEDFEGRCPECNGRVDLRPEIDDDKTAKRLANSLLQKDKVESPEVAIEPAFAACPNRRCGRVRRLGRSAAEKMTIGLRCSDCGDRMVRVLGANNVHEAAKICEEALASVQAFLGSRKGEYRWGLHVDFPGHPEILEELAINADHARALEDKIGIRKARRQLSRELFIWKVSTLR